MKRPDRLSPGKTQKPKGTLSRAALSCDGGKESQVGDSVNRFFEEKAKKIQDGLKLPIRPWLGGILKK